MSTVPPWLRALVDDAAVFPPGNAALPDAVRAHQALRASPDADLVGPIVVPATSVDDLVAIVAGDDGATPLGVALVGTAEQVAIAGPQAAATPALLLESLQCRLPGATRDAVDLAVETLRTTGETTTPTALELPLAGEDLGAGWRDAAATAATHGVRVKLRTGGLSPDAFPTPRELATAITTLVGLGVPFQCTAGLHHAVRAEDPDDGLVHHGFLNVLLATRASLDDADLRTVSSVLEEMSADVLVEDVDALGAGALTEARRWFTSFGSCSTADPAADLRTLGLL
ncbi:hypothetical protein [Mumia sp. DW29H23]|uniref:hypothetical protein n=1 Tax=Mumia sp. DW29H23 TaxID=3421241 RepID=UPI003D68A74F